jgi:hypothetical protein
LILAVSCLEHGDGQRRRRRSLPSHLVLNRGDYTSARASARCIAVTYHGIRVVAQFVLDAVASLSPRTRSMFGCLAINVQDKNCPHPPLICRDQQCDAVTA